MLNRKSSNTIEYAKKGAAYGGFFGSSLGFVAGLIESHSCAYVRGFGFSPVLPAAGLFVGVSAGAIVGTSLGLFGSKKNQQAFQSAVMTDKANELQNTNQTALKK